VDAPIIIDDGGSETDSEDDLPTIEELLGESRVSKREEQKTGATPAAEALIGADTNTSSAVGLRDELLWGLGDGGGGGDADRDAARSNRPSEGEIGLERSEVQVNHIGGGEDNSGATMDFVSFDATLNPTAVGVVITGDLPHQGMSSQPTLLTGHDSTDECSYAEHGDGSAGDCNNSARGFDLQSPKQRKRTRSLSVDTTTTILGTADPDSDEPLDGPHLAKRQRPYLRTGDESVSKRVPTPKPHLSAASEAEIGDSPGRMDNERPGAEHNSEATVIGGESDASDNGTISKTADRGGRDNSGGLRPSIPPNPLRNRHRPSSNRPAI
jgi:hypothetical protein